VCKSVGSVDDVFGVVGAAVEYRVDIGVEIGVPKEVTKGAGDLRNRVRLSISMTTFDIYISTDGSRDTNFVVEACRTVKGLTDDRKDCSATECRVKDHVASAAALFTFRVDIVPFNRTITLYGALYGLGTALCTWHSLDSNGEVGATFQGRLVTYLQNLPRM
jgi:hypothetical protein